MLSASAYLLGVLELSVAVGGAAVGANRVRGRLLPGWSGPPAWVVDLLFTLALLIWVGEALGSVGLLEPLPFALLAAGIGLALRLRVGPPERFRASPPPAPGAGLAATVAAIAVSALLAAHWSVPTQQSLAHGMSGLRHPLVPRALRRPLRRAARPSTSTTSPLATWPGSSRPTRS